MPGESVEMKDEMRVAAAVCGSGSVWQRQRRQQRGLRYGTNNEGTYRLNVAIRTADHIIRSSATRTHCNLHCIASHRVTSCHIVCRVVVSSSRRPPTHAATMASAPPTALGQGHVPPSAWPVDKSTARVRPPTSTPPPARRRVGSDGELKLGSASAIDSHVQ